MDNQQYKVLFTEGAYVVVNKVNSIDLAEKIDELIRKGKPILSIYPIYEANN